MKIIEWHGGPSLPDLPRLSEPRNIKLKYIIADLVLEVPWQPVPPYKTIVEVLGHDRHGNFLSLKSYLSLVFY